MSGGLMMGWKRSGPGRAFALLAAAALAAVFAFVPAPREGQVTEVIDGDSIRVMVEGIRETVRLIGIDTPEFGRDGEGREPFAAEAARYTREALLGREVRLEFDEGNAGTGHRDAYDRLLAYVFVGERLFNAQIVESGWARTYRTRFRCARTEEFIRLEEAAKAEGRGIWGAAGVNGKGTGGGPIDARDP